MICISILPFIIGLFSWYFFKNNILSKYISLYMIFLSLWQVDVSILYTGRLDSSSVETWFKILRIGSTMSFPALMTVYYVFVKTMHIELKGFYKIFLHRYVIIFLYVWSAFVYIIGLSPYEITSMMRISTNHLSYLFPQYGRWVIVFYIHIALTILGVIGLVMFSFTIKVKHFRQFFISFGLSGLIVVLIGVFNFSKIFNLFPSSMAVSLFVIGVLFSYTSLHRSILNDIQQKINQQSQLQYFNTHTSSLLHEIKNPLTVLQGFIDILISSSDRLDSKSEKMVNHINTSTQHIKSIVLSFSEFINSGKMSLSKCDLNELIEGSIDLMKNEAMKKGIEFNYTSHILNKVVIYVDQVKLRQVFINLYKNSIEAIPNDRKNKKISIILDSHESMFLIDIKDTGIGIPRGKWHDIFHPFETSKETGMGLGLSIVHHIMIAHSGSIEILNSNKNGTHIRILLPKYTYQEFFSNSK